jgi:2-C-methyl-D-erythritol 2,4-cyclodiphosphate synthase
MKVMTARMGDKATGIRVGLGIDFHRFGRGRPLIIGGVSIEYDHGLIGHSDADVLTHAICDGLLGAAGLGDIGTHFPDTDQRYRGVSSLVLLKEVVSLLSDDGWDLVNLDATVVAQQPRLTPYFEEMKTKLAKVTHLPNEAISLKATTSEMMGAMGRGEGICALCVALIQQHA